MVLKSNQIEILLTSGGIGYFSTSHSLYHEINISNKHLIKQAITLARKEM